MYHTLLTEVSGGEINIFSWADPEGPPENHKNIGILSNTVPDPLKNHKATKPAFNVGQSSACQRNAIKWRFAGGPMMARL